MNSTQRGWYGLMNKPKSFLLTVTAQKRSLFYLQNNNFLQWSLEEFRV